MSVIQQIKLRTIDCIRHWMRSVDPGKYYLEEKDKVSQNLNDLLVNFFKTEFNIEQASFQIYSLENEFIKRLESVMSEEGHISIEHNSQKMKYDIVYKINGVSNWQRFKLHQKKYEGNTELEYNVMSALIKQSIEHEINHSRTIDKEQLYNRNMDHVIVELFRQIGQQVIESEYGVLVGNPYIKMTSVFEDTGTSLEQFELDNLETHQHSLRSKLESAISSNNQELVDKLRAQLHENQNAQNEFKKKLQQSKENPLLRGGSRTQKLE